MPLTPPVRTWVPHYNNALAGGSVAVQGPTGLLALVNRALNAGATCDGSSNGTNAGAMDAVNRWATIADVVPAAAGVNHSWFVLHWPNGKRTLISYAVGAGNPHLVNIDRARAAFTGGSLTADPTPPADHVLHANRQFLRAAYAPSHYHDETNEAHDFMFCVSPDGSNLAPFGFAEWNTVNAPAGTTHPYAGFDNWHDGGRGAFRNEELQLSNLVLFRNDGTAATTPSVVDPACENGRLAAQFTSAQLYELFAVPVAEVAAGGNSVMLGTLPDTYWVSTGAGCNLGDQIQDAGTPGTMVYEVFGDIAFPNVNTQAFLT